MPNQAVNRDSIFFRNLPSGFTLGSDAAEVRLFREYGAVFIARGGVTAPDRVVFKDEGELRSFQSKINIAEYEIGGFPLRLQAAAMYALQCAITEATESRCSITPRGANSAHRNHNDTIALWNSRVEPALVYWVGEGKMTRDQADAIRKLPSHEQVSEVFALERKGIYFAKDLSKSIVYSVAPPGASQHLSLLAFDVAEFEDARVRAILSGHFWFQTVVSDLPHFTFLGVGESELPGLGLKKEIYSGREFWVPDI